MKRFVIAAVALSAMPGVAAINYYIDQFTFRDASSADGKVMKGMETFEEAVINPGDKGTISDPLEYGVSNVGPRGGFPTGLNEPNLRIQANTFPGPSPATTNPSGAPDALYIAAPGFIGANSTKIGEDLGILHQQLASYDLIFLDQNKTGIGFELSRFNGYNPEVPFVITIYGLAGNILDVYNMPSPGVGEPTKKFFGVWSDQPIGRINIFDDLIVPGGSNVYSPSAVDNIEMWVPEPGSAALVALGAMFMLRPRRACD